MTNGELGEKVLFYFDLKYFPPVKQVFVVIRADIVLSASLT